MSPLLPDFKIGVKRAVFQNRGKVPAEKKQLNELHSGM
jgi:hypothetical protein